MYLCKKCINLWRKSPNWMDGFIFAKYLTIGSHFIMYSFVRTLLVKYSLSWKKKIMKYSLFWNKNNEVFIVLKNIRGPLTREINLSIRFLILEWSTIHFTKMLIQQVSRVINVIYSKITHNHYKTKLILVVYKDKSSYIELTMPVKPTLKWKCSVKPIVSPLPERVSVTSSSSCRTGSSPSPTISASMSTFLKMVSQNSGIPETSSDWK